MDGPIIIYSNPVRTLVKRENPLKRVQTRLNDVDEISNSRHFRRYEYKVRNFQIINDISK